MSLDQLLAALEREAGHTAEQLRAEARAEAARVTADAERDLARRRDTATGAAAGAQRAELERAIADAARAARRDTLVAREQLLHRVFHAVSAALPEAIAQPLFRDALPARVAAAAACLDTQEPAVLRCSPSLLAPIQAAAAGYPAITVQAVPDAGSGFRLATADGTIEVDDTLESRLEAGRTALARSALRLLEQSA